MNNRLQRSRPRPAALNGCLAACLVLLAACNAGDRDRNGRIESFGAGRGSSGERVVTSPLQAEVNGASSVDRITPTEFEGARAAPGHRLVVLDVTVANPSRQPQVFSEGKLVAVNGADERSFGTPVSMLSDGFLTLQVLQPRERIRGRIVYEVPRDVPGKLFWSPGSDGPRIAVHLDGGARAIAGGDDAAPTSVLAMPSADDAVPATDDAVDTTASDAPPDSRDAGDAGQRTAARTPPRAAPRDPPAATTSGDQLAAARTCNALVVRNDPGERARWQQFFRRQCAGLDPPPAWGGSQVAGASRAPAGDSARWPPREGPAYQCRHAWTRVEHMICNDADLSRMDWELARAYANARRSVDDPEMLQRLQDGWRFNVRDNCPTRACVEDVYARRINDLNVIAGD